VAVAMIKPRRHMLVAGCIHRAVRNARIRERIDDREMDESSSEVAETGHRRRPGHIYRERCLRPVPSTLFPPEGFSVIQMFSSDYVNINIFYILRKIIYKYAYPLFSYAFFRNHLLLKENTYPIRDLKFYMT
jgi:hypothetical protein